MTDQQIIKELQEKEHSLMKQLNKVRVALAAFIDEPNSATQEVDLLSQPKTKEFDQFLSYDQRVILALRIINVGYIDHMVDALIKAGDETPKDKLFSGLTGAASRLYRKHLLKADTRGKKYKYSLNDTEEAEKERADILPLDS